MGSYTDSPGMEVGAECILVNTTYLSPQIIRRHVADYIAERDGTPADWRNVMLCAGLFVASIAPISLTSLPGASEGIRAVMKLMTNPGIPEGLRASTKRPGVMIPIPQVSSGHYCYWKLCVC